MHGDLRCRATRAGALPVLALFLAARGAGHGRVTDDVIGTQQQRSREREAEALAVLRLMRTSAASTILLIVLGAGLDQADARQPGDDLLEERQARAGKSG